MEMTACDFKVGNMNRMSFLTLSNLIFSISSRVNLNTSVKFTQHLYGLLNRFQRFAAYKAKQSSDDAYSTYS